MLKHILTHNLALADKQTYIQVDSARVKTNIVIINIKTYNPSIGWFGLRFIRYNCFGVNDYSILLGSLKFQPSF